MTNLCKWTVHEGYKTFSCEFCEYSCSMRGLLKVYSLLFKKSFSFNFWMKIKAIKIIISQILWVQNQSSKLMGAAAPTVPTLIMALDIRLRRVELNQLYKTFFAKSALKCVQKHSCFKHLSRIFITNSTFLCLFPKLYKICIEIHKAFRAQELSFLHSIPFSKALFAKSALKWSLSWTETFMSLKTSLQNFHYKLNIFMPFSKTLQNLHWST